MNVLKPNLAKAAVIVLALSLCGTAVAQEVKIGVVNIAQLLEQAPQARVAMEALDEEFKPRQREILAKQTDFQTLSEKVQRDLAVMGETERRNAEKDLRDMQREVARLQNEFREDLNLRRNEELGTLQRSLLKEVQDYAQAAGYDLVVGDGVLYASSAVNITENVLRAMEANFQAAGN
ncbi:MAG: OmpH family outer membrane protein [Gammaproteobacteria bacterium]|nr:OmpH family outer membrane protein [Gammaproteobacteria bacterium]MDH5345713.1 OmpH family outer membrane protein [Gammaproteobacteria bacterium]